MMISLPRSLLPVVLLAGLLSACAGAGAGGGGSGGTMATFKGAKVSIARNVVRDHGLDLLAAYRRADAAAGEGRRADYNQVRMALLDAQLPPGTRLPVIVYSHGCAGLGTAAIGHLMELGRLDDFVLVAPDSFARDRPKYCFRDFTVDLTVREAVVVMRHAELQLAVAQLAERRWVDRQNIFLIGHSQGGGIVAGYDGPVPVRGRVLLNGSCRPSNGGGNFASGEAVLTLDTGRDPWFQRSGSECRALVEAHPGGRSIYDERSRSHNLALQHWPEIKAFLQTNRR